jgi:hypothetical protein
MKRELLFITALMLASVLGAQNFNQRIVDKFKHHSQKRSALLMNYGTVKLDMMQTLFDFEGELMEAVRTQYEYNGQGQVQAITELSFGETELMFDSRNQYYYANGYMSYELHQNFNADTEAWDLEDSLTYTYEAGLLVREDYFWYDALNDEMDHDEISYFYYTGTQLDSIIITRWDGTEYLLYEKEAYEYENGEIKKYSYFEIEDDGSWLETERMTNIWENGKLQEILFQEVDEMIDGLVNAGKTLYTWQENDNLGEEMHYEWNGEIEDWDPIMRMNPFYNNDVAADELVLPFFTDEEGNPLTFFTHQIDSAYMDTYDAEAGWMQVALIKFHYSDFVGMNETVHSNASQLAIYPNPATDRLNVKYSFEQQTSASICDNLGRIIKTVTLDGSHSIDISDLNSGFYYLILTGGENSGRIAKFVVE